MSKPAALPDQPTSESVTPPKSNTSCPSVWAILLGSKWRKSFWILVLLGVASTYAIKLYGQHGASTVICQQITLPAEALPVKVPLRIALIADIHDNRNGLLQALEHIKQSQPDLIIFAGDLYMSGTRLTRTRELITTLKEISALAPSYAILGNQDMECINEISRILEKSGFQILRNQRVDWTSASGASFSIVGLGDCNEGDESPQLCMLPRGEEKGSVLLLSHDPESRHLVEGYDWDLMLSGHTHGGQLANPATGENICMRSDMPAGLYPWDNRYIFVSQGLGSILGMRFFCPPEVNIIDIPASDSEAPAPETKQAAHPQN